MRNSLPGNTELASKCTKDCWGFTFAVSKVIAKGAIVYKMMTAAVTFVIRRYISWR